MAARGWDSAKVGSSRYYLSSIYTSVQGGHGYGSTQDIAEGNDHVWDDSTTKGFETGDDEIVFTYLQVKKNSIQQIYT